MITSSSNTQVKRVIQLSRKARERKKQQIFVVEGRKMFQEAPPGMAGTGICDGEF